MFRNITVNKGTFHTYNKNNLLETAEEEKKKSMLFSFFLVHSGNSAAIKFLHKSLSTEN